LVGFDAILAANPCVIGRRNGQPRAAVLLPNEVFNHIVIAWAKSGAACP